MRFIHAADLHIDSPLKGLQRYPGAPAEQLREATREAFGRLVRIAIEREVDFVVVAGDLFDGQWPDMQTGLWTAKQFRHLADAGIDLYFIRGNHDAASKLQKSIRWPENVHEFPTDRAGTILREDLGVALHGQGFARPDVRIDLAENYPPAVSGLFNIGLLHTSLAGHPQHDNYAPTSDEKLAQRGYQYWALGHIHARQIVRTEPHIVFAGNTQGRHVGEAGEKGCLLVEVDDTQQVTNVEFCPTDTARWYLAPVDLTNVSEVEGLLSRVRDDLTKCLRDSAGRPCLVRLLLRGTCSIHQPLTDMDHREQVIVEIQNLANECDEDIWIEQVKFETRPTIDLDRIRQADDLLGEMFRYLHQIDAGNQVVAEVINGLPDMSRFEPILREVGVDLRSPEQMRNWLRRVEGLLLTHLEVRS
jgi:DNA repair exonuclease SbcCD nuclease subunit